MTMITPSYLGETIEYSSLHACRSTLEDPTAESLIPLCKVGFMERPERMVLLILGGLFNRMAPALWVIAIVATLTVIHRILHTWQETKAGRTLPGIRLSL